MEHERQTLEGVTDARATSMNAASIPQKAKADLLLTGVLRPFFGVAERYPQLKANQNFLALQNRISELEERIADRREFFNDDVTTYNTRIAQLPDVFLARVMKLQPRQMFRVNEQEPQQVEVKLALAPGQGTSWGQPPSAVGRGEGPTLPEDQASAICSLGQPSAAVPTWARILWA